MKHDCSLVFFCAGSYAQVLFVQILFAQILLRRFVCAASFCAGVEIKACAFETTKRIY